MESEAAQEHWQVEANGQVYDTNFAEMTQWIDQGALLRADKVRRGSLRWIEAGRVPALLAVFNAKDNGKPLPVPVITTTKLSPTVIPGQSLANPPNLPADIAADVTAAPEVDVPEPIAAAPEAPLAQPGEPVCKIHPECRATYACETCANLFCGACPTSYGGSVKICPFCGAMCRSIEQIEKTRAEAATRTRMIGQGFGFGDLMSALGYPLKFKTSLIFGAIMFMIFSIGQSAVAFGGIFMLGAALFCFMLANMLSFGILATTVENFSQGKMGLNFMPPFEDFAIWDDVVHPFFLSIGVYISSFGPLILLVGIAVFFAPGPAGGEMNGIRSDAVRTIDPELPYAANAAKQSETVRDLLNKTKSEQERRVADLNAGKVPEQNEIQQPTDPDQANSDHTAQVIADQERSQLESSIGKTPETVAKERNALARQLLGYGFGFVLIGVICLLWGLFYFPAACAVAGYTRSFSATVNPSVGFDTIRRLGSDYFKVLLMCLVILILSAIVSMVLGVILAPFDMPALGNVPARAIASLFGFYFSVVFSCVVGYALFKASDRLKLPA